MFENFLLECKYLSICKRDMKCSRPGETRCQEEVYTDWTSLGQRNIVENVHSWDDLTPGQLEEGYQTRQQPQDPLSSCTKDLSLLRSHTLKILNPHINYSILDLKPKPSHKGCNMNK